MPLTPEEVQQIQADLTAGTFQFATHPVLAPIKDLGLVVRTTAQEQAHETTIKNKAITDHDRDAYTNIEAEVEKLTGVKKTGQNEKASTYFTRAMGLLKTKVETLEASGQDTAETTRKMQELNDKIVQLTEQVETEKNNAKTGQESVRIENLYEMAINGVKGKVKKSLDATLAQDVLEARVSRFKGKYDVVFNDKGEPIVKTKDGIEMRDSNLKPRSIVSLMEEEMKEMLEAEVRQPGSGATPPLQPNLPLQNQNTKVKPKVEEYQRPETVTSKIKLHEDLVANGFSEDEPEFQTLFEAQGAQLPLR